jgi:hypothetical protein
MIDVSVLPRRYGEPSSGTIGVPPHYVCFSLVYLNQNWAPVRTAFFSVK